MDVLGGVLPGGWWDGVGRLHRDVEFATLTGRDEEALTGATAADTPQAVTAVLTGCLRRIGDVSPVPAEVVRELLVADREFLLIQLRRATFGDRVHGDLFCPWPDCGRRVSVDFRLDDVQVRDSPDRRPWYELALPDPGGPARVRFRLPNGGDVEALAGLLPHDEGRALTLLLARCLLAVGEVADPAPDQVADLSGGARASIEAEMERLAPAVDRELETPCPECGRSFAALFDVRRYLFGELRTGAVQLYREVHRLAYHYHWGEGEIMAMPRSRRQTYLDLLFDELERLDSGG